jgi:LmbE family N-acetylglucosaminyl deacetylase
VGRPGRRVMTVIEPMAGTDESRWASWSAPQTWPTLDVAQAARRPVLVVAAHPDDEVLGVGGLLAVLARLGADLRLLWATDGEASHPGSTAEPAGRLAAIRRSESSVAAERLGLAAAPRIHLGLPDGRLTQRADELTDLIGQQVRGGEVVLAPWSGDGHPDHEACGRAARQVSASVLEYPVWAWHWAEPGDARVPWSRARRVDLDPDARERKAAAVGCFGSQVEPIGSDPLDGPVLPDRVLAHFRRQHEVVLA